MRKTKQTIKRGIAKANLFLTSVYCVAHRTNLTAIDVLKVGPYKDMSREINALLNSVTMHFKKSCKIKSAFLLLQEEFVDL